MSRKWKAESSAIGGEALRRADVLSRYIAIPLPSAEDDDRFARELGLSIDTMLRLATVWRRHRNSLLLVGPGAAAKATIPDRREVLADKIDMTGVSLEFRPEMLARIRAIQRHIVDAENGIADMDRSAASLGLSVKRFEQLVRLWKAHPRANAMPGAMRMPLRHRRNMSSKARRTFLLDQILAEAEPGTKIKTIIALLEKACLAEGLKPPSASRAYELVRELRSRAS